MEGRSITTGGFGGIDEGGPAGRVWRDPGRCVVCRECWFDQTDFSDTLDPSGASEEAREADRTVLEFSVKEPERVRRDRGCWDTGSLVFRERGGRVEGERWEARAGDGEESSL